MDSASHYARRVTVALLLTFIGVGTGCQSPDVVLVPLPPDIEYPWAEQPTSVVAGVAAAGQRINVAATNAIAIVRSNADLFALPTEVSDVPSTEATSEAHGPHEVVRVAEDDAAPSRRADDDDEDEGGRRREADDDDGPVAATVTLEVAAQPSGRCVDVNTASLSRLESLPRIGPAMSARIVEARPFRRNRDLLDVSGIGPATYAQFEGELCPD